MLGCNMLLWKHPVIFQGEEDKYVTKEPFLWRFLSFNYSTKQNIIQIIFELCLKSWQVEKNQCQHILVVKTLSEILQWSQTS